MDIFFETLAKTDSMEEAFEGLRRHIVKKKLEMADVLSQESGFGTPVDFEEIWELTLREKALRKIMKKA